VSTNADAVQGSDRERAVDAHESELGIHKDEDTPVSPTPPVENPVEDEETGISPDAHTVAGDPETPPEPGPDIPDVGPSPEVPVGPPDVGPSPTRDPSLPPTSTPDEPNAMRSTQ
jgi:hypothetical protein